MAIHRDRYEYDTTLIQVLLRGYALCLRTCKQATVATSYFKDFFKITLLVNLFKILSYYYSILISHIVIVACRAP